MDTIASSRSFNCLGKNELPRRKIDILIFNSLHLSNEVMECLLVDKYVFYAIMVAFMLRIQSHLL